MATEAVKMPAYIAHTPKRNRVSLGFERNSERRRSLFASERDDKSDSELSNISPLSSSSGVASPAQLASPALISPDASPKRRLAALENNFTQLILERTPSKSLKKSPKIRGVSPLKPDRGVITPKSFYGSRSPVELNGAEMVRKIRLSCPARMRLFLDDIPRDKKRARGGSSEKKRPRKKLKLEAAMAAAVAAARAEDALRPPNRTPFKEVCNWESLSFRKSDKRGPGKRNYVFFTSQNTQNESPESTSPSPTKKKKLKSRTELDYDLSPMKIAPMTIIDTIKNDFEDLYEEEDIVLRNRVKHLLNDLEDRDTINAIVREECETPSSKIYPVFENSSNQKKTPKTLSSVKAKLTDKDDRQYQLDVGQSNLREIECATCGLVYCQGDTVDEKRHDQFHNHDKELRFNGWKSERVAGLGLNFRVVQVLPSDPAPWWIKVREVEAIAERELGSLPVTTPHQAFLYVVKKRVVGLCSALIITSAFKMLSSEEGIDLVSEEEYPVKCGIARLWVHPQFRQRGVATQLVDAVRRNFMYGRILDVNDIAFSVPTDDGKKFAAAYTQTSTYLVFM